MFPVHRRASNVCWGIVICVVLAGCAETGAGQTAVRTPTKPVATATAPGVVVPPIHTIDLGDFQASVAFPMAHGLLLFGNPGTVGQPIGPAGARALYYYDNSTQSVSVVATPTATAAGVERGIRIAQAAGDWAVYYVGDGGDYNWEIWALNVVTKERRLVSSQAAEQNPFSFINLFMTDGTSMVWAHTVSVGGQRQTVMALYDLASGTSRTLLTVPETMVVGPEALSNGTLIFTERPVTGQGSKTAWLWKLSDPAPTQFAVNVGLNFAVNDRYVVWDVIDVRSLTLYDRGTGKQTNEFEVSCIRPELVTGSPYVVCVDWDGRSYRLARLPSGDDAVFFDHQESEGGIYTGNGRAYWIATTSSNPYGNHIDYIEMPTS